MLRRKFAEVLAEMRERGTYVPAERYNPERDEDPKLIKTGIELRFYVERFTPDGWCESIGCVDSVSFTNARVQRLLEAVKKGDLETTLALEYPEKWYMRKAVLNFFEHR